ncbi:Uncharacterised protein [Salmonella bongori]|nr:Uncharacterised protein [Salmonella bongori]
MVVRSVALPATPPLTRLPRVTWIWSTRPAMGAVIRVQESSRRAAATAAFADCTCARCALRVATASSKFLRETAPLVDQPLNAVEIRLRLTGHDFRLA